MYYYIQGGNNSYFFCNSITDEPYPFVFCSYKSCKHFIGYVATIHDYSFSNDSYNKWFDMYTNCDEKFIGKLSEWNYKEISFDEKPSIGVRFTSACGRLYQKFCDRSIKDNCERVVDYINTKLRGHYYDW